MFAAVESTTIVVALVVSVVAPSILASLTTRQRSRDRREEAEIRRQDKDEDYARQDKVAADAAAAAERLLEQQQKVALAAARDAQGIVDANLHTAQVAEAAANATAAKLDVLDQKSDQIHHLVDGTMTAAMESEYGAVVRELAMMHEVISLKEAAGKSASRAALEAIATTEAKVDELKESLAQRHRQLAATEAQAKQDAKDAVEMTEISGLVSLKKADPPT